MARYDAGYCKLHRRIAADDDSIFHGNVKLLGLWSLLLLWANWQDGYKVIGRDKIILRRGQLITSQDQLCDKTGCSRKELRLMLDKLVSHGSITVNRAKRGPRTGTVITIVNYDFYQSNEEQNQPEKVDERAKRGPKEGQKRAKRGPHSEAGKQKKQGSNPLYPPEGEGGGYGQDFSPEDEQQPVRQRKAFDEYRTEAAGLVGKLIKWGLDIGKAENSELERRLGSRGAAAYDMRFGSTGGAFLSFWEARKRERSPQTVVTKELCEMFTAFLIELDNPEDGP